MELSYGRAEFIYLVVVWGLPVDMASYIYQSVRAEALKNDAQISLMLLELDDMRSLRRQWSSKILEKAQPRDLGNNEWWLADSFGAEVADMDVGWKKKIAVLKEVLKGMATSAELFPLTQWIVLIEKHLRRVRNVLKLTSDDDGDDF
ncbi:hypothetical protein CJ030_MR4G010973 [Morella rubra]|uniref:Uncharacterized protein n=1 Tax=Morella rubra TaxID=262757 RepID=A0A6A1VZ61_9ROSI|nr:hypothetical protein CJ030_MR4G010973 [Morella rubra]